MVLLVLVMVLAVAVAQDTSPAASSKIQTLEKQVEILTNLVHAQSNIMGEFSCSQGSSGSNSASECILKVADQAKKIAKLEGDLTSLQSLTKTQENDIQQLQTTLSGSYADIYAG
ncbi:---NA--- [Paramuricea clavata]|uniref:---NA n=1 Tax=Paramuricea clavata TaxID=317549 RepID=A0A6S7IHB1_PARCT|nr:---NA--- [Paramuricea clavata]